MHAHDERLTRDHEELGELLAQLIASLEAKDIARSYATLDLFWARLAVHIRAEHLHLFPAILRALRRSNEDDLAQSETLRIIDVLRSDHEFFMRELAETVLTMRGLLSNAEAAIDPQVKEVSNRISKIQARLERHNEVEEKGVYLWTTNLLDEAEQSELATRVHRELENMPPRFEIV